jgi:hypothetical protein
MQKQGASSNVPNPSPLIQQGPSFRQEDPQEVQHFERAVKRYFVPEYQPPVGFRQLSVPDDPNPSFKDGSGMSPWFPSTEPFPNVAGPSSHGGVVYPYQQDQELIPHSSTSLSVSLLEPSHSSSSIPFHHPPGLHPHLYWPSSISHTGLDQARPRVLPTGANSFLQGNDVSLYPFPMEQGTSGQDLSTSPYPWYPNESWPALFQIRQPFFGDLSGISNSVPPSWPRTEQSLRQSQSLESALGVPSAGYSGPMMGSTPT